MRFHVIGLPHAATSREHCSCAYTSKTLKFCKMMAKRGHEIIHYGVEGSNPEAENITIMSKNEQKSFFGDFDYHKTYYPIKWDSTIPYWQLFNSRAAEEVSKCASKDDFVCILGGTAQSPLVTALNNFLVVEYGVGYYGICSKYRVFESYAHMHNVYGMMQKDSDGKFFDAVIPNYFDIDDFSFNDKPDDYCLFMGRLIARKGLRVAVEASERARIKLVVCGQGVIEVKDKGRTIIAEDGNTYSSEYLEYVGYADIAKRNELMGNATAIIAPTIYLEPFGGVAVEAQLTGTPAITTDWGAFPETIDHGVSGYRCRTLEQFVWALSAVKKLDRQAIRDRAVRLYSMEKVGAMYEEYFEMLWSLWGDGWYAKRDRTNLNWLIK